MAKTVKVSDMTSGNPTKHILVFALPLLIGNMFQQLYNTVDSFVVGKFVSAEALAATGTCGSTSFLFFALSSGLAIGIGIIISQYFGAGDEKGIRNTVANSFYILIASALIVSLLGIFLARPLLTLLNTPADIIDDSVLYLRTSCFGIIFIALYNGVASTLRALGNSKTPLVFLIISSFLNIGFDLLFVLRFQWGVFGVAFATVIAQAVSATISLIYAFVKVPYYRLSKEEWKPQPEIIKRSFKLGVPMALQSSMIAVSLMVLQGTVNKFGTAVMSAYTITGKVDIIASQLYNALASSLTTYAGQNLGANKTDRVSGGYKRGHIITLLYNLIIIPIIVIFAKEITGFFVNDPEVIEFGTKALRITTFFYIPLGAIYVPRGTLNGCGDAKFSLINGITEVICRIIFANLLTELPTLGVWGIWWASAGTWTVVAVICNMRYLRGRWKIAKRIIS